VASIVREIVITAPAEHCWDAVRAFDALHVRLAPGFVTALTMTGDRERRITFASGAVATETLVGIDDKYMRLAYKIDDGPMHATHYNASVQVIPHGAGQCRFVWAVDILPDELAGRTAQAMDTGLTAISAALAGGAELSALG
jgi:polyketide cyclase/dehydrase/lipid transport protein